MKIFLAGATGATGRLLLNDLLKRGHKVRAVVRSPEKIPEDSRSNENLEIITADILDLSDMVLADYLKDCDAAASCLGHNLNFKGIYGQPRKLVEDVARRICKAFTANKPEKPVKYVLMNTSGNRNRDLNEQVSVGQHIVVGLIRLLLPPHADNEKAADYLRTEIGRNNRYIEWAAVRPDNLIDAESVSEIEVHPSPVRSAIFNPGQTSRINVASFMADLLTDDDTWKAWKGRMPVIYNAE